MTETSSYLFLRRDISVGRSQNLDLSRFSAGCSLYYDSADLGAEVIKIEPPTPSPIAGTGPSPKGEERREKVTYFVLNRNKKGVAINLRLELGRQIFYRLA